MTRDFNQSPQMDRIAHILLPNRIGPRIQLEKCAKAFLLQPLEDFGFGELRHG
jgi:hypothetical protein